MLCLITCIHTCVGGREGEREKGRKGGRKGESKGGREGGREEGRERERWEGKRKREREFILCNQSHVAMVFVLVSLLKSRHTFSGTTVN